ncbi:flap endonuclease GEN-like 1 [Malania oleifera]|uniref:flap endonuclease GEN-like 1 n=1 Tax=Malania oleifera TaxID=397392 RepID=UPI0025AE295A|nr:flap endonuclease GEN-like 1 [Malania oleifera]
MGVGGHFWDLLKPYARSEGFDFLRDKRIAVDLSFWIVQHETAVKAAARHPHLRLTFFRTINLFSKFGAFPVFVVDGTPSPLKSQARIARFLRASGVDLSSLPLAGEGVSVERNGAFMKCVQECVELLELLGMPVLKAKGEAEALCAQLNSEGHVDACITADSDAFLFGAKCVIKSLHPNCREPIECYHISDIEAGLGLKRKQLIAISLMVGVDHDLNGVQGIGLDTALRFVRNFDEDEILNRLHEIGHGDMLLFQDDINSASDFIPSSGVSSPRIKNPHCSLCGHPGSKKSHYKFACEHCKTNATEGCIRKPVGFRCACFSCDADRKEKELKKHENWRIKVCKKISMQHNFPNDEIIDMYLSSHHGYFCANDGPCLSWESPKMEMLVDFLAYHQLWEPSYIRQRMLPMLSTIFLREKASNPTKSLLIGQYEFDSILRVKIRFGHPFYLVKWKKAASTKGSISHTTFIQESDDIHCEEVMEINESVDLLDEPDGLQVHVDDGCWFLLTDENTELVRGAFPGEVKRFLDEKELKELKRRKKSVLSSDEAHGSSGSPKSRGVQLNITEFYRSTKASFQEKHGESIAENSANQGTWTSKEKRKASSPNVPKSVRRRLLFD